MRTAQELYEAYEIMPGLQLHQLRVAAVAKTISESLMRDIDVRTIVLSCLIHDMGNIIKSELELFPEFLEPLGIAHWQLVKDRWLQKYGADEHHATLAIAEEIGVPSEVLTYIDGFRFSELDRIRKGDSFVMKICKYSDLRVSPHGVLSMQARLNEGRARYADKFSDIPEAEGEYRFLESAAHEIERQIFDASTLSAEDLTEDSIKPLIEELRAYPVA